MEDLYQLHQSFLAEWPLERVKNMTLQEYTNLNRDDSFCYWLESKTSKLGSIWGGSAFKFGVFKSAANNTEQTSNKVLTDGEYVWLQKYGETKEQAFFEIKNIIVSIIENSINERFEEINNIDLGDATKWKIAFLYSNYKLFNTFNRDMLLSICDDLMIPYDSKENISVLNQKILATKKTEEDYFEFGANFWSKPLVSQSLKKALIQNQPYLSSYFHVLDQLINAFNLTADDAKFYFNYEKKQIIFTIGQRYVWNVDNGLFKYISLNKDETIFEEFSTNNEIDAYLNHTKDLPSYDIILPRIKAAVEKELNRTTVSGFNKHNKSDLQRLVFDIEYRQKYFASQQIIELNNNNNSQPKQMNPSIYLLKYKKQIILQGPPGTGKTREAKLIAKEMLELEDVKDLKDHEQFKLIQFHPSYTYEDFVRGIASKLNDIGEGIIYEAENKVLAAFAEKALTNYLSTIDNSSKNEDLSAFDAFIESIKDELAQNDKHKYNITESVYLFSADETRFKYKGDNWAAHSKGLNMKFSELKKIIDSGATERQDIKKMVNIEELTRQHATYFIKVIEKYHDFKKTYNKLEQIENTTILKNYILVIDEINRANLSAVLGELIYALEYRGEAVESMYSIDEENKLILPPNLYIIGTMNTADRSVGHIDYAIRRRFAFVDVLPKDLSEDSEIYFDSDLFKAVAVLFHNNLSSEFDIKDVQLGHSYFIVKKDEEKSEADYKELINIKLQYEIKPLLLEYVKDGILINKDDKIKNKINDLKASI